MSRYSLVCILLIAFISTGCQEMLLKRGASTPDDPDTSNINKPEKTTTIVSTTQSLNVVRTRPDDSSNAQAGSAKGETGGADSGEQTAGDTPVKTDDIENHPLLAKRRDHVGVVDVWKMQGRVSILTEEDGWIGTMNWSQFNGNRFDIRINGPIGGAVILTGEPGTVTMKTSKHKPVSAQTPEALLRKNLGWNMPVSGLRYWVLGLPNPKPVKLLKFDKTGRPVLMEQEGWEIQFLRYHTINGKELPKKIYLKNKKFTVKLLIKYWNMDANAHQPIAGQASR